MLNNSDQRTDKTKGVTRGRAADPVTTPRAEGTEAWSWGFQKLEGWRKGPVKGFRLGGRGTAWKALRPPRAWRGWVWEGHKKSKCHGEVTLTKHKANRKERIFSFYQSFIFPFTIPYWQNRTQNQLANESSLQTPSTSTPELRIEGWIGNESQ